MHTSLSHAIHPSPPTIVANAFVCEAIALLNQTESSCILVVEPDCGQVLGVFSERDVVRLTLSSIDSTTAYVAEVITQPCFTISEADLQDTASIVALFQQHQLRGLPIVNEQGQPVGLVTSHSLLSISQGSGSGNPPGEQDCQHQEMQRQATEMVLRRQLNRALLLQKITNAIRSQCDPQQIFETTVAQVGQVFGVSQCYLLIYQAMPTFQLTVAASYTVSGSPQQIDETLLMGNPYLLRVLTQDRAVVASNVYTERLLQSMQLQCQQAGLKSILAVRTSYQSQPNGLLLLHQRDRFRQWTPIEIRLIEAIAAQVGIVLAQIRLLDHEKQQREALDQQNLLLQQEIRERQAALRDLKQAEERLELFFSQSLDGFFFMMLDQPIQWDDTIDKETTLDYVFAHQRITKVNDAMLEQYGTGREQFVGLTPHDLFAHDQDYGRQVWQQFFDAGTLHIETEERKMDGTPIWIEGDYRCLYDAQGRITGHFGVQRDVSDRKQAEASLKCQQKFLRSVIDIPPNLIFAKDWDGKFVLANQATAEIYGTTVEALIGKGDVDFNPNLVEVEQFLQDDRDVIRTQHPKLVEEFVTSASGETRCFQTIKKPIASITGQSTLVLGVATDITERKQMEQALRLIVEGTAAKTGRAFFHSLVRHLAEVLQVRYAFVTELIKPQNTTVRTLAFWQGDNFGENLEYGLAETPCERVITGEIAYYQDSIQTHFPNHKCLVELGVESCFGIPLNDSLGKVIGHLQVLDTKPLPQKQFSEQILRIFAARAGAELERKQAEDARSELLAQTQEQAIALEKAKDAAEAANRAKSEFLANMSHELRTPLNAILGFTQIMNHDMLLNPENREYVNIINRSGQHLLTLINDVLEMSKIEAGRLKLHPTSFDFYHLLDTLYEMLHLKASVKQLSLTFHRHPHLPQSITADEGKLRQVLLNLLGNAIKFTRKGWVTLRVTVEEPASKEPQNGEDASFPPDCHQPITLCFEIADTGLGIAPSELQRLFTPFVQTHTGQQSSEGTGLGLTISQKFVQLMGGIITVESVVEQGSIFRFKIPVNLAPMIPPSVVYSTQRVIALAPDQPHYRLLIVEDHWENQQILVKLLQPLGFDIQVANNGQEGLAIWECWFPHLILMDIRMPVLNGYEATQQIRAREQQRSAAQNSQTSSQSSVPQFSTKIIAVTSSAFDEERSVILETGCDDLISKPFREEEIFAKLAQHLGVQYVYEKDSVKTPENAPPDASASVIHTSDPGFILNASCFKGIPVEWMVQFHKAAVLGKDRQMLQLIEQIPVTHLNLAQILREKVINFCFGELIELTKSVSYE